MALTNMLIGMTDDLYLSPMAVAVEPKTRLHKVETSPQVEPLLYALLSPTGLPCFRWLSEVSSSISATRCDVCECLVQFLIIDEGP